MESGTKSGLPAPFVEHVCNEIVSELPVAVVKSFVFKITSGFIDCLHLIGEFR